VPSRSPSITVEFHAVNYRTRPGGMLYRYRMVGVDMTWKQTREPYATYTGLPVGEYTFEVEAIDLDLTRSESPATVDIEVFYEPMSSVVNIRDVQLDDIFPSLRHAYAYQPLGSVRVINDDSSPVEATVGLYIPAAVDRPVERTITLAPHSNQVLPLEVTLSDDVLERQGSAPVQAEVSLSCEIGEKVISVRQSHTVTLHGRGALTWDETAKAAAFVTPDDPQVAAFARGLLAAHRAQLPRRRVDGNVPVAMLVYEALATHGIRYAPDASTPYSQMRADKAAVDNIQYPAQLLSSRQGDCDDCTVLYCALLENLGVATALVEAPDHIFLLFDAGVPESRLLGFGLDDLVLWRDERMWIPVEITKVGEGSFVDAWRLGTETLGAPSKVRAVARDRRAIGLARLSAGTARARRPG